MCFPFFWMLLTSFKSPAEVLEVDTWMPQPKYYLQTEAMEEVQVRILRHVMQNTVEVELLRKREPLRQVLLSDLATKTWLFSNYPKAWNKVQPSFGRYFFNSFLIALLTTLGQVLTSILAAYAFVYFEFPYKNALFTLFLATMMVPQEILLIPNYLVLANLGWIDTYAAMIVPWLAGVFGIFMLRQFFQQLPREFYDAAVIDGCSRLGFLFRILVPLSLPPIVTITIFTFLGSWNSLLWPLIVTNSEHMRTIQVGLSYFAQSEGTEWELLMAASSFCILPLVIAYFAAQRFFVEGDTASGLKG